MNSKQVYYFTVILNNRQTNVKAKKTAEFTFVFRNLAKDIQLGQTHLASESANNLENESEVCVIDDDADSLRVRVQIRGDIQRYVLGLVCLRILLLNCYIFPWLLTGYHEHFHLLLTQKQWSKKTVLQYINVTVLIYRKLFFEYLMNVDALNTFILCNQGCIHFGLSIQ